MNWVVLPKDKDILHYGVLGMKWRNKKGLREKEPNKYASVTSSLTNTPLKKKSNPIKNKVVTPAQTKNKIKFEPAYNNIKAMLDGKKKVNLSYIKTVYANSNQEQRKKLLKMFNKYPSSQKIMKQMGLKTHLDLTFGNV